MNFIVEAITLYLVGAFGLIVNSSLYIWLHLRTFRERRRNHIELKKRSKNTSHLPCLINRNKGISIVFPTYNEGAGVFITLKRMYLASDAVSAALEYSNATPPSFSLQLIVVDGGSKDNTIEVVKKFFESDIYKKTKNLVSFTIASGGGGRGPSMNAGAAHATEDILLFLHADTALPKGFDTILLETYKDPDVAMAAFEFGIDRTALAHGPATSKSTTTTSSQPSPSSALLTSIERGANFRSSTFHYPYGDQALSFPRRYFLDILGGFPPVPIFEDYILVNEVRTNEAAGRYGAYTSAAAAVSSDTATTTTAATTAGTTAVGRQDADKEAKAVTDTIVCGAGAEPQHGQQQQHGGCRYAAPRPDRFVLLPHRALCSPRRWVENGALGTTVRNLVFVLAYEFGGYSPRQIFNWYYGRR